MEITQCSLICYSVNFCLDCLISWKLVHGFTAVMASYLILGEKKKIYIWNKGLLQLASWLWRIEHWRQLVYEDGGPTCPSLCKNFIEKLMMSWFTWCKASSLVKGHHLHISPHNSAWIATNTQKYVCTSPQKSVLWQGHSLIEFSGKHQCESA